MGEITYPFPNFNGTTVEVWEWISNFIPYFTECDQLSLLGLDLIPVIKRGPWCEKYTCEEGKTVGEENGCHGNQTDIHSPS